MKKQSRGTTNSKYCHFLQATIPKQKCSGWSIDEARKHAFRTSLVNPSSHQRCIRRVWILLRWITFCILYLPSHSSKTLHIRQEILNYQLERKLKSQVWCASSTRLFLVKLYLKYCAESAFEPLRRSTLFSIIKVSLSVHDLC